MTDIYLISEGSRLLVKSSMENTHIFFCDVCCGELDKEGDCWNCNQQRLRLKCWKNYSDHITLTLNLAKHFLFENDNTEEGYRAARSWYLGELCPISTDEAYEIGLRLMLWLEQKLAPHRCDGEKIDDGYDEYYICDNSDDPRCPQHRDD
jgi:hypothetical protein